MQYAIKQMIQKNKQRILYYALVICAVVIVFAVLFVTNPTFMVNFLKPENITGVLYDLSSVGIMAVGFSFVMITAGIDLSGPAVMTAGAVVGAKVMVAVGGNIAVGFFMMMAVCLGFGLFNGIAVAKFRIAPLIVTLTTMILGQGVSVLTARSTAISVPELFSDIFNAKIGSVPVPLVAALALFVFAFILLNNTKFGRGVYAVGINERATNVCGISGQKIIITCYVLAALFYAIAAVFSTARLGGATAAGAGDQLLADIICSAIIGGISTTGGVGSISGVFFGSIIMILIRNTMNLNNVEFATQFLYKGIIILAITFLDTRRKK